MDVGGEKRLKAIGTVFSAVMLSIFALIITFMRDWPSENVTVPFLYTIATVLVLALTAVLDLYCSSVLSSKVNQASTCRLLSLTSFSAAMIFAMIWVSPVLEAAIRWHHTILSGVAGTYVFFSYATYLLTTRAETRSGKFVGYDENGLPHWKEQCTSGSSMSVGGLPSLANAVKRGFKQVVDDAESRQMFYFLCLNLTFTGVEFVYGIWTNSLGLLSDSFHMLFDCSALVVGLYASVISKWKSSKLYPYGFTRFELLAGYINGLFLCVIAFYIFTEAISRLITPPEIKTDRLLIVSTAGLLVNLAGLFLLGHHHHHGGGGECSHSHSDANMRGVFLHVLADTLGSVGVIISTLLISYFGWTRSDAICSFILAGLIFSSVWPLLQDSGATLILSVPQNLEAKIGEAVKKCLMIQGVRQVRRPHFWKQSDEIVIGSVHVITSDEANEQLVSAEVCAIFRAIGVRQGNFCVQVEKAEFAERMLSLKSGLSERISLDSGMVAGKKEVNPDGSLNDDVLFTYESA